MTRMQYTMCAMATAAAILAGAPMTARSTGSAPPVTLAIAGRTNATPSIAAMNQHVAVAWGATLPTGGTDVYAAVSRDGGRTFRSPVRVNDVDGNASLGLEQPPRISIVAHPGHDPSIVVVWTAKSKDGTRLLVARSDDGGAFTHAVPVVASEAVGNRGWLSTTVDRNGRVIALWLDHRDMAPTAGAMSHEGHAHADPATPKPDGAARAQLSKVYAGAIDAPVAQAITGGVCYCCKTALTTGPDGSIYAAWRHVYPGNIRDIAFAVSRDGARTFSAPSRVSDDHWMLDGCPENGPALAVSADGMVHALWPTLVAGPATDEEPALALFHAATRDGRTFSPRERVATEGTPRHPQLSWTPAGLVAAWDEETGNGSRRVVLARFKSGGSPGARVSREAVSGSARAQTPALAGTSDGVVLAWTEGTEQSVIRVERR